MIGVIGVNHKTAGVELRESFSISMEEIKPFSEFVLERTDIEELVVLSTCNRTEVYFYHQKQCCNKTVKQVTELLAQFKGVHTYYDNPFYVHTNQQAVKHLFGVTSGVDSMVLGDDQIVKQVKEAYLHCTKLALTDAVLMRLFQKSFETGKRVRSQTNIQQGATSVSYVAVDNCEQTFGSLADKRILIIGAGDTGRVSMSHLSKRGAHQFTVANRSLEKAAKLATEFGGKAIALDQLHDQLPYHDIVFTATAAGHILVNKDDVATYAHQRQAAAQMFVDLSVPRNIDKNINGLDNISVVGVDDLQAVVDQTNRKRTESLTQAGTIIDLMVDEYFEWLDNRALRPIIKAITSNMQKLHKQELHNSKQCYTGEQFELIDEYAGRLTQKYIRTLIKSLKDVSHSEKDAKALHKIKELFEFVEE